MANQEKGNFKMLGKLCGLLIHFFPIHSLSQWQSGKPKDHSLHSWNETLVLGSWEKAEQTLLEKYCVSFF